MPPLIAGGGTVAATVERFGGLQVLYNNAGGATPKDGKVTEIELEEFWRTIGVDLFGTFLGCRYAIPVMVEGGAGSIINTTSIRAMIGTAGADAYTSAKGGVRALTQALALQWAEKNIRVNAIAPGVILTERVRALLREDDLLFITADHGNDPTTPSTDHARESVPLLVRGARVRPVDLGARDTFADLGATVGEWLGVSFRGSGRSFLAALGAA